MGTISIVQLFLVTLMLAEHLLTIPKAEYKLMQQKIEQLQSAVNTLEKRLHGLADNVPGMIYQFCLNLDGSMSLPYVSSGCQQIYELEPHCIQQDSQVITLMVHPDDIALLEQTIMESAHTLQKWELEWRIKNFFGCRKMAARIFATRIISRQLYSLIRLHY